MLKIQVSKNISGQSMIDGVVAASMSGSITESGNVSISKNIVNNEVYMGNKKQVRDDMSEFESLVYEEQDNREVEING